MNTKDSSARALSNKSIDAFRTIGEVSGELDVPRHVLRFWESRFTQIRPMKRGGGRRYYRPEDVSLIKTIRDLLYDQGYTIKGAQRFLRETGQKSPDMGLPPIGNHEKDALKTADDKPSDSRLVVSSLPPRRIPPHLQGAHTRHTPDDRAKKDPMQGDLQRLLDELTEIRCLLDDKRT